MRWLIFVSALFFSGYACAKGDAPEEPIPLRLLRTIHTGNLQQLDLPSIYAYSKDKSTPYAGYVMAQAALLVLGAEQTWPDWPASRVLTRTIDLLQSDQYSTSVTRGMPEGYGTDDLVFTLVFAMVISDQADKAIDVLQDYVASESRYTRFVVFQALRHIGNQRATDLLKTAGETSSDSNYVHNLLSDMYFPFADDLLKRLPLIPPARRARKKLVELAKQSCGERPALAVYFLGFLANGEDQAQVDVELNLLRELTQAPCLYSRILAVRALALRSPESIQFWLERYHRETDAWLRAHIVRILFIRFGREFLGHALELLADEPTQYVQWELMHANIEIREGAWFRDYWELWQTHTLQYRLSFPQGWERGEMATDDVNDLLVWLENGHRPKHLWVRNHMLYGLASDITPEQTRRFLRIVNTLPDKVEHWWVLTPLDYPQALPLLRYWATLSAPEQQQKQLADKIFYLERMLKNGSQVSAVKTCCHPTRACLLSWVEVGSITNNTRPITNEDEARAWLERTQRQSLVITFTDTLSRIAQVKHPGGGVEQWEHLYGCWTRVQ